MLGKPFIISVILLAKASVDSYPFKRIWNGSPAVPHTFPYAAFIKLNWVDGEPHYFCQGILISSRFVLTDAFCIDSSIDHSNSLLRVANDGDVVILGAHNQENENEPTQSRMLIKNIILHPDYKSESHYENNIGLIELETPVRFSDAIQPARLSDNPNETYEGKKAKVAGWGGENEPSAILKVLEDVVINLDTCKKEGINWTFNYSICLSGKNGNDLGYWDYGVGLQIDRVVVGISSAWAYDSVQVYTRIDHFIEWIRENSDI